MNCLDCGANDDDPKVVFASSDRCMRCGRQPVHAIPAERLSPIFTPGIFTPAVDTREPIDTAYPLHGYPTIRVKLDAGDYAEASIIGRAAIERKTGDDFVSCSTWDRPRAFRSYERLSKYEVKAIVIEASFDDILSHRYQSAATPQSVIATSLAIIADFGIPVIWAGNRENGERATLWILRRAFQKLHGKAGAA